MAKFDFEWPTQMMLDQMPPDVSIKSIEFGFNYNVNYSISAVRCTLSHGQSHDLFHLGSSSSLKTFSFSKENPVKFVSAISTPYLS